MANISKIKVGNTSYGITATPTAHASTATTYGAASASKYGHVKLSDNYKSSAGAAASGIGASSLAVYNAYNTLNSNLDAGLPVDYENLSYSEANNKYGALVITTKTEYSTLNSRKFNDYAYLCFELLINGNSVRASIIIPSNRFIVQGYTVELSYVDSSNVQRWVSVTYKSDTSFHMVGSSNIIANNTRVHITGLKAKKSFDLYTDVQ